MSSRLVAAATAAGALIAVYPAAAGSAREAIPGDGVGNPCTDDRAVELRCPDLRMRRPYDFRVQRTRRGRVLLRTRSSLDSVGAGPVEISGHRIGRHTMDLRQRIHRRDGSVLVWPSEGRLHFYHAVGHGIFWKLHRAARFELRRLGDRRLVRVGGKLHYCLRDLRRTRKWQRSPRRGVYPACSQNPRRRQVILGTSAGWSDIYGPHYHRQYIDVTGLRGCFGYWHTADPDNVIAESNEQNNSSRTVVSLPWRGRPGRCRGR